MPTPSTFIREQDGSLSPQTQKAITEQLYQYLNEYSIEQSPSEHRNHLGVSIIGEKCARKLWYSFRWVKLEQPEPRMRRLFKRGHSEEAKFVDLLSWMGFCVRTVDPETKKQYRFSAVNGHYGGSGDSVALLPWFRDDERFRILIEYKTHNKRLFEQLKNKGLSIAQPKHEIQMHGYGRAFKLRYGLYCAINKDDDDIYFEWVNLDWQVAELMEKKASDIIYSQLPPPRIAENPAFFECKWCSKAGICWHGENAEVNCRSCKHSQPIENAQWRCNKWETVIPNKEAIEKGCASHESINQ